METYEKKIVLVASIGTAILTSGFAISQGGLEFDKSYTPVAVSDDLKLEKNDSKSTAQDIDKVTDPKKDTDIEANNTNQEQQEEVTKNDTTNNNYNVASSNQNNQQKSSQTQSKPENIKPTTGEETPNKKPEETPSQPPKEESNKPTEPTETPKPEEPTEPSNPTEPEEPTNPSEKPEQPPIEESQEEPQSPTNDLEDKSITLNDIR